MEKQHKDTFMILWTLLRQESVFLSYKTISIIYKFLIKNNLILIKYKMKNRNHNQQQKSVVFEKMYELFPMQAPFPPIYITSFL